MSQWVSIWRAAQLAGVPRAVLQQQVRSGAIEETDGRVSTASLLALSARTWRKFICGEPRKPATKRLRG